MLQEQRTVGNAGCPGVTWDGQTIPQGRISEASREKSKLLKRKHPHVIQCCQVTNINYSHSTINKPIFTNDNEVYSLPLPRKTIKYSNVYELILKWCDQCSGNWVLRQQSTQVASVRGATPTRRLITLQQISMMHSAKFTFPFSIGVFLSLSNFHSKLEVSINKQTIYEFV